MKKDFYILSIFFVFIFIIPFSQSAEKKDSIIIGMSAAFSGPSKNLGSDLYHGIMTYLDHVNQNGGVNGRKIELKT